MKLKKSELRQLIREEIAKDKKEDKVTYSAVLQGGSIGEKRINNVSQLKGEKVIDTGVTYDNIADAKARAKSLNKLITPGEKNYYGLKYVVAAAINGIYTGKSK